MEYKDIKEEQLESMTKEELVEYIKWLKAENSKVTKWWIDASAEINKGKALIESFNTLIKGGFIAIKSNNE